MKKFKIFACVLAFILCLSVFTACKDNEGDDDETSGVNYYTVKFTEVEGGDTYTERRVKVGDKVSEPVPPEKAGYIFDAWYKGNIPWNFDQNVTSDMILSAHWISAESVFEHTPTGDGKTTVITRMKTVRSIVRIPTVIGGYTVTGIGDGVFAEPTDPPISQIFVPDTVTSIGTEAFKGCEEVTITVDGTLSDVGEFAFYGCKGLTSVKLKEGMTKISAYAFSSTGITQIIIPKTVTVVDENAFDGCSAMLSAALPCENVEICNSAFNDTNLKILYLYGTDGQVAEFFETGISAQNEPLLNTKIYLYSAEKPTADTEYDGFWYLDENERTRVWK